MFDITMCPGAGCHKKDTCYRHTATPRRPYQVWAQYDPEDCKQYWPIDGRRDADDKWEQHIERDPNTGVVL
jgi:hypothetical protein